MKRLFPNTIFARLFALVAAGIIISHVMTFALVVEFSAAIFHRRRHRIRRSRYCTSPATRCRRCRRACGSG
jgi:hypothetical protein